MLRNISSNGTKCPDLELQLNYQEREYIELIVTNLLFYIVRYAHTLNCAGRASTRFACALE